MLSVLKKTSAKSSALTEMTACGLCNKRMTLRALRKHLGHHQEQLALFALPSNLDETEDDPDDEEHDSLLGDVAISEGDDEEEVTDTSDGSEAEEPIHDDRQAFASRAFTEEISNTKSELDIVNLTANATPFGDESTGDDMREVFDASKTDSGSRTTMLDTQGNSPADVSSPTVTQPFKEDQSTDSDESALQDVELSAPLMRRPDGSLIVDPVEIEQERKAQDDAELIKPERLETSLTAQHEALIAQDGASEQAVVRVARAAPDALRRDDENKLPQLNKLRRAQEYEQIQRELAADHVSIAAREHEITQATGSGARRGETIATEAAGSEASAVVTEEHAEFRTREEVYYSDIAELATRQRKAEQLAYVKRILKQTAEGEEEEEEEEIIQAVMRRRLARFGFKDDQIEAMVHGEEEAKVDPQQQTDRTSHNPHRIAPQPSYAKIRREHLDINTLHYYDIPYEYDTDPNYIIVLREMSQRETDVLFEHTRRLRSKHGERLFNEADGQDRRGRKEYAFVRRKSRDRARSSDGSRSAKDAAPGPTVVR
jgi:hypothetical protein